jgi:hypothetical protein
LHTSRAFLIKAISIASLKSKPEKIHPNTGKIFQKSKTDTNSKFRSILVYKRLLALLYVTPFSPKYDSPAPFIFSRSFIQ